MMLLMTIAIHYEQDVVQARQRTRELAEQLGFEAQDQARLATAVSEIARNAFQYAQGGTVEFYVTGEPQTFQVRVHDRGQGIPHLAEILAGQYQSQTGMGLGIVGTRRLMDTFEIDSVAGQGTMIVLGKTLPKRTPIITASRLEQIQAAVLGRSPQNPYEEIQQQNQELLAAMAELRKREEELTRLNQELEDTNRGVVALYAELDEKASSLQQANELKTRFLSNMSHEFRTPLNSIMSLSRMLLAYADGDLTAEQAKQVTFIQTAASGLSELVNDLLDLAKVEAGKIEVHLAAFEVKDLFGTLRGMLRPLLVQGGSVSLIVEEPEGLPPLYSDEGKVAQILRNFVSNALKFTESGEVRVTAVQTGHTITFSVADTGIGIPIADQARIFDDFVQIESHLQKQVKGTGLGLPLSRKLADLLGGRIEVRSQPGQGSTFTAVIPIAYPHRTELLPLPQPMINGSLTGGMPILIVEDHPETLFIYEKHLQGSRYQPIATSTLAQARQVLQQIQPAAIVLDILLEGENGWTFLQALKSDPTTHNIPILIITVIDNEKQAMALGANGFLIKPIDRLPLLEKLNMLVAQGKTQKILLIHDDPVYGCKVKQLLANTPLQILETPSGQDGYAIAEHEQPTVILVDLEVLNTSGSDILDRFNHNPNTQSIPVIIHSSKLLDADFKSYLTEKSIDILDLENSTQATDSLLREALIAAGVALNA